MENNHVDASSVTIAGLTAVMLELSRDLVRAQRAAVRVALAEVTEEIGADRATAIASAILTETESRYRVAAGATLIAIASIAPSG
jgi:hypothetical protein